MAGTMSTLYKGNERFIKTYFQKFPGYYDTCDAGIVDNEGYVHILARDDDVINVAGHRLSTSALEEVVLKVRITLKMFFDREHANLNWTFLNSSTYSVLAAYHYFWNSINSVQKAVDLTLLSCK